MPANGRAGAVFIDQSHGKRVRIDAAPLGSFCAQGQQERWKRPCCCPVVRLAEERHSPPSDDTAHLEVRKCDIGDRFEEDSLIGSRDEVLVIVAARGPIVFEEGSRRYHDPSVPYQWFQLMTECSCRRTAAIRNGTADADE